MRPEKYPPQEPLSDVGAAYHVEAMDLGDDVDFHEEYFGDDPYQGIALFRPERPNGDVLAFLHGGGWTNGYKEWMGFMAGAFTAAGVLFASVGYRLAPRHVFPSGLEDCTRAIAWLHEHIAEFGGNNERIFVGGHSAGGHYAALAAVRRDWQAALNLPDNAIRGCLPISGVYDFTEGCGLADRPRFLGAGGNEIAASPLHNIDGSPPPFLIAHGDGDFPHLIAQAEAMEAALAGAGGDVERMALEGRDHFTASFAGGEAGGPWVPGALHWMTSH